MEDYTEKLRRLLNVKLDEDGRFLAQQIETAISDMDPGEVAHCIVVLMAWVNDTSEWKSDLEG